MFLMGKKVWFQDAWTAIKVLSLMGAIIVLPQSIATVASVEKAKEDMFKYVDSRHEDVSKQLSEIKESQKLTESRIYEILMRIRKQ